MKIHNLLEDIVIDKVGEIFSEEDDNHVMGFCTCEQCKLDVACYVLNRTDPQYVISWRGYAHLTAEYVTDSQKTADLTALILEGIKKVSRHKRPFFSHSEEKESEITEGPFFNFPVIAGRVFNGKTFEPVSGIEINLTSMDEPVPMQNPNWQNPYLISESTAGNFMFWPRSVKAEKDGMTKSFNFRISLISDLYEEATHVFSLELTSCSERLETFSLNENYLLDDFCIFLRSSSEDIVGAET